MADSAQGRPIDVASIISQIPYQTPGGDVYAIEPRKKYIRTIEEGYGNCSNLAFGLAYELGQRKHAYKIVHLMPPGFLQGEGHTVLSTTYEFEGKQQQGIVDLLEGGLPVSQGRFVELADLRKGHLTEVAIAPLSPLHDDHSPYYGEFLDRSVLGVLDHEEVERYFAFLEANYVSLGNEKLDKYVYDGLALVLGYYPAIYVAKTDRATLLAGHGVRYLLALTLLWSVRALLVLLPCLVIYSSTAAVMRRRAARAGGVTSRAA